MFKKGAYRRPIVVLILAIALVSFSSLCQAAPKKYTINAISAWPKTTFMVQNFMRFIERVNKKAAKMYPGELEIKYKGGSEVISFKEQVEAVRTGLIDMVFTTNAYYTSIVPVMDTLFATTLRPWEEREKGVYDYLQKLHQEKANCYFLSRMGSGIPFQIYLNKQVKAVADLKGLKIRCSPPIIPFLKKVGANPVVMGPGNLYTALERGVVDGYIWPAAQIREWGWEKVTKYVLEPPLPYQATDVTLVNLDVWKKLPKHLQDLLTSCAIEDEYRTVVRALEYIPRENANLKKSGMQFIYLSEAEAKKLEDTAITVMWEGAKKRDAKIGAKLQSLLSK